MPLTDLLRSPDLVRIQSEEHGWRDGERGGMAWTAPGVRVEIAPAGDLLPVAATVDGVGLQRLRLRWRHRLPAGARILGDALERAYGDLAWRGVEPERILPWYALVHADGHTGGIGVRTGAGALATWSLDETGVSLDLDCRSGGVGVRPGPRVLRLVEVVAHDGDDGARAFAVARAFCRRLCPHPRLPARPVYGANNWYYAYGRTDQAACLDDAARVAEWSTHPNRPFMVLDDGWQEGRTWGYNGGPWTRGNAGFPDMAALADGMRARGTRPGLWYRPLLTDGMQPRGWALDAPRPWAWVDRGRFLDPTIPEVRAHLAADLRRLVGWGFELIKHDFTTYDLLGWWGSGIAGAWIADGWSFADRSRTSAEVVRDLYALLREAAGDALLIGCDTIGHLAAGTHELQRTGDDTSGRSWERTRRMGVNTLAFRMPQHDAFFAVDADCVGITREVPWERNAAWLDLLARSGTPLFVSAAPDAVGPEQAAALRRACASAAEPRAPAEPLDWLDTSCPRRWRLADGEAIYDWTGDDGCPVPGAGPGG